MGTGWAAGWNKYPTIQPGPTGPLAHNPFAALETPYVQYLGVGDEQQFRYWGIDVSGYPASQWWFKAHSGQLDAFDQFYSPDSASERVRTFDVQRCVSVPDASIVPTGVSFELVRAPALGGFLSTIERLPTIFDEVSALDENGVKIFTYSQLNGLRPCLDQLVHPDPAVTEPLRWRFHLRVTHEASMREPIDSSAYQGPVAPAQMKGSDLLEPWSDFRYGDLVRWGDRQQIIVPARSMARLFVTLFGPSERFAVRVGARLSGYRQLAGRRGSAVNAATLRIV